VEGEDEDLEFPIVQAEALFDGEQQHCAFKKLAHLDAFLAVSGSGDR